MEDLSERINANAISIFIGSITSLIGLYAVKKRFEKTDELNLALAEASLGAFQRLDKRLQVLERAEELRVIEEDAQKE